ncbi:LysM peptidoglycan-binding domain-containing protein [Marinobacterium weihaiense]|uniref:LysM peptidoglycan-binding domain-containing protein n=1 Tax=Marinobacterium weihaiense TaxID=2851016 RepID=A0ABS6M9N4_9GAMM|nr:LysM domain-containing protein [Marinobacterium weihaiense]MBV0932492.1 LysM peptidoglycan-binding domain-containing protein [Marinobacterium weihaiense]
MLKSFCTAMLLGLTTLASATADAADTYRVKRGDSLSSIAARVLGNAERWREIWSLNPQIRRPAALEVGEQLQLPGRQSVPAADSSSWQPAPLTAPDAAQAMALDLIRSGHIKRLRANYRLLDSTRLTNLPRVYAWRSEADGQYVYLHRGSSMAEPVQEYGLFISSLEPSSPRFVELSRIGRAEPVMQHGNKTRLRVTENHADMSTSVLLLPLQPGNTTLTPAYPQRPVEARILKALYEHAGGYRLVLDQGTTAGLKPGHLLQFYRQPEQPGGWAMIIDATPTGSLALVLSARQVPAAGDVLR